MKLVGKEHYLFLRRTFSEQVFAGTNMSETICHADNRINQNHEVGSEGYPLNIINIAVIKMSAGSGSQVSPG